jgi:biotin carboxyl carrier protein
LVNGREAELPADGSQVEASGDRLVVRTEAGARTALSVRDGDSVLVSVGGRVYVVGRTGGRAASHDVDETELLAPMPGVVAEVLVVPGQSFEAGERLAVLEAMKTLQPVSARRAGTVAEVAVAAGDQVTEGQLLVRIEVNGAAP